MNFKKSMVSIAAATLIVAGFAGCDTGSNSTTNASNGTQVINTPKGTVTGTVMDTNGNPLSGVKVYLANKEAVTNAGGLYTFFDVPVTNTAGADAGLVTGTPNNNQILSVTIAAPAGYLGATVTVTPSAQIDGAEDTAGAAAGTGTTSGSETFIDGYLAQAGTAVLPHLGATVTGKLELATSQEPVTNQEITLDFLQVNSAVLIGANVAQTQNGVITTYATGSYKATTDANGMFTIQNVPADTDLTYVVGNYIVVGEQAGQVQGTNAVTVTTNDEVAVINVGDIQVTPIVNNDVAAPFVTSVTGVINNNTAAIPAMLEDNVRGVENNTTAHHAFVVNFSETMKIENDKDYTDSVIVKTGKTRATMTDTAVTVTVNPNGKSLTITTPSELPNATLLDINLLVTDFKDAAGNYLTLNAGADAINNNADNTEINYDTVGVNAANVQVIALQLQIFKDLNTYAPAVTVVNQQTIDANGATNDAAGLQALSDAFNDTIDSNTPDNVITQMNSGDNDTNVVGVNDAAARLAALGTNAFGSAVTVTADVPRVTFTPSGAAAYMIKATRTGADVNLANANVTVQNGATVAAVAAGTANANGTTTTLITPADAASITPVEFVVATGTVRVGDILTITPIDDLGYVGTSTPYTLKDNVTPTTVLQKAYTVGNSTTIGNTVVKFGDGAELSDTTGTVTVGTPYLPISAGLLDNKTATGATVTGALGFTSDNTLTSELYALNTINTTATPNVAYIASGLGMYDTTAWAAFNKDSALTRTLGVAFSEDVSLNGIIPSASLTSALSAWTVNNDTVKNDDGVAVNVDLIDVTTSNVLTLANIDTGKVIDFTGISDTAKTPNVTTTASNARVVLLDKMPPFVETASFDGTNVVITFNEPIRTLANGEIFTITGAAVRTATYNTANIAKYVFSNSNKTLTIAATEFTGLTKADFNLASYVESAYGTVARAHAALEWTVNDANGNDWAADNAGVVAPKFAVAEMIGNFTVTTNASAFLGANNTTTTVQTVVWTFAHPIKNDAAGELMNSIVGDASAAALSASGYVWDGTLATDQAKITTWFEGAIAGGATTPITYVAVPNSTSLILSSDKKTLTFKFTTTADLSANDVVRMKVGKIITSNTDTTQTVAGNALAATAQ